MLNAFFYSVKFHRSKNNFFHKKFYVSMKLLTLRDKIQKDISPLIIKANFWELENCQFGHALDYFMSALKILSIIRN